MKQHYFNFRGVKHEELSQEHQKRSFATWRLELIPLLVFFLSVFTVNAQVDNYGFTQSVGTYTPLTGGTILGSYVGTSGASSLDNVIYNIPNGTIPFSFQFDGQSYTGLNVSANGFVTFGETPPTASTYTPLSATTAFQGAIAAFTRDLQGGWVFAADRTSGSNELTNVSDLGLAQVGDLLNGAGIATGATISAINGNVITMSANATSTGVAGPVQVGGPWANIQYGIVGTAPNRTFVVEYNNLRRFGSSLTVAQHMRLNFQIRLNEADNTIEVVYGDCSPGLTTFSAFVHQVGLRGQDNSFPGNSAPRMNTKGLNDNWLNSADGTTNASGMVFNGVAPANVIPLGLTYRWELATCFPPQVGLTASNITTQSADLAWSAPSVVPDGYEYVLSDVIVDPTVAGTPTVTNTISVSGLSPNTQYFLFVRSICNNNPSGWRLVGSFFTACAPVSEFFENFDSYTAGANTMANCWVRKGTSTATTLTTGAIAPNSPPNRLLISASGITPTISYVLMPVVNNLNAGTHRLTFKAYATAANRVLEIGYLTDEDDENSFVFLQDFLMPSTAQSTTEEFIFTPGVLPANAVRLAFLNQGFPSGTALIYVDDVAWGQIPSCLPPTDVATSNITPTTVDIIWAPGAAGQTEWSIEYGLAGFTQGDGTLLNGVSNPTTISSLMPATNYQFYVQSNCAVNDDSIWVGPFSFTTGCVPVSEFFENFDSYTAAANTLPICWLRRGTSTATTTVSGAIAPNSPANRLLISASGITPTVSYALMPVVDNLNTGTHRLKFKAYATAANRVLEIGYLTDANDENTFVYLQDFQMPSTTQATTQEFTFVPGALPANAVRLAFLNQAIPGATALIYVDDVLWEQIPSCPIPFDVETSNTTPTSVDIAWTPGSAGQTVWTIEYGLTGFTQGDGTVLSGLSNPTTIGGLTSSTNYQFYLQGNCDVDDDSLWVGPFSFRTLCDPPFITDTTGDTICGEGSATLSAVAGEGSVVWFATEASTTSLFEGPTFTTPIITETTSFWAAAVAGGSTIDGLGRVQPATNDNTSPSNWGLSFTATSEFTISTVDVYITATVAGNLTVNLTDASGIILQTTQIATPPGSATSPVLFTVPLDFTVQPGNYRLLAATGSPAMVRETSGITYPYGLGGFGEITSGFLASNTLTTYYWFYNWSIITGCVGPKVEVVATVTEADAISVATSEDILCLGQSTELSVSSVNNDYEYEWQPGGLLGAVHVVSPSETTTYTVTATDALSNCVTSSTVTVTVNPVPGAVVINNGEEVEICVDETVALVAVGGALPDQVIFEDDFNAATNNWTTVNNSTGGTTGGPTVSAWTLRASGSTPPTPAISSPDNSQFYLSNSDAAGSTTITETILTSPAISTIGVTEATLSFQHFFRHIGNSIGAVETSTDGTIWTQLTSYTATVGTAVAFVTASLPLPEALLGQAQVYVRFKYNATWGWYWAIDNVSIIGTLNSEVTWSPATELYLDAEASQPYAGQETSVVYAKGVTSIVYTATATNDFGCETSQELEVTVNSAATPIGDAVQEITGDTATFISDIVVAGTNIVWYASLQDALNGTNPLDPTTELVDGATYYAVSFENGCSSEPLAVTVNVTLSLDNLMFADFNFYPNPVNEVLFISNNEIISSVKVINLLGQEISHEDINANQGEINLSNLPQGSYLIKVQVDQFTKIVKVIKN
jgi:hypothetical protein